jgi:hypothetical protein
MTSCRPVLEALEERWTPSAGGVDVIEGPAGPEVCRIGPLYTPVTPPPRPPEPPGGLVTGSVPSWVWETPFVF